MKRWMLTWFATLSLLMIVAGSVASPAAAAPGGNADNARACQQGGWETLARDGDAGTAFVNQGECVRYGAQGGTLVLYVPYVAPSISVVRNGTADIHGDATGTNILYCGYLVTYDNFDESNPPVITFYHDGNFDSVSSYHFENGYTHVDIVPFGKTQVIVVTDPQTGEVLATGAPQACEAAA